MARDRDRDLKSQSGKHHLPYGPKKVCNYILQRPSSQAPSLASGVLKSCRERGGPIGNAAANDSGKAKKYSRIFRNIETDRCRKHRQPPTDASPSDPSGNANEPSGIRKKKSYCRKYFRQYDFIKTYFRPALRRRDARTAQPFGRRPDGAGLPDNPDNRRTNRYPTLVVALI